MSLRPLTVTSVRARSTSAEDRRRGLLAWVCLDLEDQLALDGISLRRTRDGRLALSFPTREDTSGRQHHIVRPVSDASRIALERQVIKSLGFEDAKRDV